MDEETAREHRLPERATRALRRVSKTRSLRAPDRIVTAGRRALGRPQELSRTAEADRRTLVGGVEAHYGDRAVEGRGKQPTAVGGDVDRATLLFVVLKAPITVGKSKLATLALSLDNNAKLALAGPKAPLPA